MPFCSFCGGPLPAAGTFCPSCGAAVPGAAGASGPPPPPPGFPPGAPPPPGYGSPYGSVFPPVPTPASRTADRRSLTFAEVAAVLFIVSGLVGAVVEFSGRLSGLLTPVTTPSGTTISLPSPWIWIGYLGGLTAVDLVVLLLLRTSFHDLVPFDRNFSSPSTLSLVAIFAIVIVMVGTALLLVGLYQAVSCVGTGQPLTRGCVFSGAFIAGLALLAVGAIAALVGFIGVLMGIWRLGTRYSEGLLKVAAVLLIFPVLNIVGAILMLVGTRSALQRVEATAGIPPPLGAT